MFLSDVTRAMLDNVSSANYQIRTFEQSDVLKSLAASAATAIDVPLTDLVNKGYMTADTAERLARNKIRTMGDLFANPLVGLDVDNVQSTRMAIIASLLSGKRG
jgi:hypothetical protein